LACSARPRAARAGKRATSSSTSRPAGKFSLIDLAGLRAYLCDLFQHETDVVVREDLRPSFREEIDRETVRVL